MGDWETVIGLECHVELSTRTKMFCGCRNEFGAEPNTLTCPVCLGHPGSLPVPNREAIARIVKIGLALGSGSRPRSLFHRKNYFYPDMPKNYQISQYDLPVCVGGHLDVELPDGSTTRVGITRVHMEEDTGKTAHGSASGRIHEAEYALIDYNRAGVPLVECVSEPDMRSPEEAAAYLRELRALLESLDVSDVRMEEGSLRCDANVSVRPAGTDALGTKVEIKNMNSVRSLERALVVRGRAADRGARGGRAARAGDAALGRGLGHHEDDALEGGGVRLPLLPGARHPRAGAGRGVDRGDPRVPAGAPAGAADPVRGRARAEARGRARPRRRPRGDGPVRGDGGARRGAGRVGQLDHAGPGRPAQRGGVADAAADATVGPQHIADLVALVADGTIVGSGCEAGPRGGVPDRRRRSPTSSRSADSGRSRMPASWAPSSIGCSRRTRTPREKFRAGNESVIGFLVGQVMKASGGSANPTLAQELLRERLSG